MNMINVDKKLNEKRRRYRRKRDNHDILKLKTETMPKQR